MQRGIDKKELVKNLKNGDHFNGFDVIRSIPDYGINDRERMQIELCKDEIVIVDEVRVDHKGTITILSKNMREFYEVSPELELEIRRWI